MQIDVSVSGIVDRIGIGPVPRPCRLEQEAKELIDIDRDRKNESETEKEEKGI